MDDDDAELLREWREETLPKILRGEAWGAETRAWFDPQHRAFQKGYADGMKKWGLN